MVTDIFFDEKYYNEVKAEIANDLLALQFMLDNVIFYSAGKEEKIEIVPSTGETCLLFDYIISIEQKVTDISELVNEINKIIKKIQ